MTIAFLSFPGKSLDYPGCYGGATFMVLAVSNFYATQLLGMAAAVARPAPPAQEIVMSELKINKTSMILERGDLLRYWHFSSYSMANESFQYLH